MAAVEELLNCCVVHFSKHSALSGHARNVVGACCAQVVFLEFRPLAAKTAAMGPVLMAGEMTK